eukprot:490905_1
MTDSNIICCGFYIYFITINLIAWYCIYLSSYTISITICYYSMLPIIAFMILILLWIICITSILKQFYCTQILDEQKVINKWLKFYCTIYLISYFTATILSFILLILSLNIEFFCMGNKGFTIMIISIFICASFGFFAFYMFLILRLYTLFSSTVYEVSPTKLHIFQIL